MTSQLGSMRTIFSPTSGGLLLWLMGNVLFSTAFAFDLKVLSHHVETFENTDCEITHSCHLLKATMMTEDYVLTLGNTRHYGTRAYFSYQTQQIDQLEEFAFAQQIRGCVFDSTRHGTETIRNPGYAVESFGKWIPYTLPQWIVDSMDQDPMYNTVEPAVHPVRHAAYRWNQKPSSFDPSTESFFANAKPKNPILYVSDNPGQAWFAPETGDAKNLSLEFKMCLYPTADIPKIGTAENIDFAQPIHCFNWNSIFVYDFDKKDFLRGKALDPFCTETETNPLPNNN